MIKTKEDLKKYLEADRKALGRSAMRPSHFDLIWKFEIALRHEEYNKNYSRGGILRVFHRLLFFYWRFKRISLGTKCGFTIGPNCFMEGLSIAHQGTIVVNGAAKIGKNCRIHVCTNIGTQAGTSGLAPSIGDNCYIGPGAKIFGPICLGNGIAIGANSVVNKSFEIDDVTIAGIPAEIVSHKGSKGLIIDL